VKAPAIAGAVAAVAVLGAAGWFGAEWYFGKPASRPATTQVLPASSAPATGAASQLDPATQAALAGATPMRERVAVVGLLNKRNGVSRDLTLKPGQAVRVGDTIIRLRACEHTAPWEQQTLTGAFVQLDVNGADKSWRRVFSGWVFKERPQLNVVLHPVYDVWVKSCTMSFPATGPDTVSVAAAAAASSAKKSAPGRASDDAEDAGETPDAPTAAPSNAT
jgi:hypothetical protein